MGGGGGGLGWGLRVGEASGAGVGEGCRGWEGRVGSHRAGGREFHTHAAHTKCPQWNHARELEKKMKKKRKKEKVLLHQLKSSHVLSWFDVSSQCWLGSARGTVGPLPTQQADSFLCQQLAFNKTECCPITKATENSLENGSRYICTPPPTQQLSVPLGGPCSGLPDLGLAE